MSDDYPLFACGTDNDGSPTCQGDGSACGYDATGQPACTTLAALGGEP